MNKNTEKLNNQIKENFQKAFYNLLEIKVNESPPDYEWITRLFEEIKDRLVFFIKKDSPIRKDIEDRLDTELFDQMIKNNAFNGEDFYKLINYVFDLCLQLGSPARDKETNEKKNEVLTLMTNGGTFAQIVPLFIKNSNQCIDKIYEDFANLTKNKK
jgi:hypothetical protein